MPMNLDPIPLPSNRGLYNWAEKLTNYIRGLEKAVTQATPKVVQLEHRRMDAKAIEDGLVMWCPATQAPIVSKGGQWYPILLGSALPIVGITNNE